jgi:hypothetical protein
MGAVMMRKTVLLADDPLRAPACQDWSASAVFESDDPWGSRAVLIGTRGPRVLVGLGSDVGDKHVAGIAYNWRHVEPAVWLWDGHAFCQATFEARPGEAKVTASGPCHAGRTARSRTSRGAHFAVAS